MSPFSWLITWAIERHFLLTFSLPLESTLHVVPLKFRLALGAHTHAHTQTFPFIFFPFFVSPQRRGRKRLCKLLTRSGAIQEIYDIAPFRLVQGGEQQQEVSKDPSAKGIFHKLAPNNIWALSRGATHFVRLSRKWPASKLDGSRPKLYGTSNTSRQVIAIWLYFNPLNTIVDS